MVLILQASMPYDESLFVDFKFTGKLKNKFFLFLNPGDFDVTYLFVFNNKQTIKIKNYEIA